MTNENDDTQIALPGLELSGEPGGRMNSMRAAVAATLKALDNEGLIEPRHAAISQLALELADAVSVGRRSGRASAAAMAAAQLLATLQALPAPLAADLKERFDEFVASLIADE